MEPYIKLGRLAVLAPYRNLSLAKLLINTALDFATQNPDMIYRPPSPTALELAQMLGNNKEKEITWQGLVMIHAQVRQAAKLSRVTFRQIQSRKAIQDDVSSDPSKWHFAYSFPFVSKH
jgi:hypothetical protein